MISIRKRKCKNCGIFFYPDPRNAKHQQFCARRDCRSASKRQSQHKWLNKPENVDYFRASAHVERVRQWRANHPGYWRGKKAASVALQDLLTVQPAVNKSDSDKINKIALQDLLIGQPFVLLGLIAHFTGTALQDDIDTTVRRLQQLGRDIAAHPINDEKGGHYGVEGCYCAPAGAPGAAPVQLGGPPPGP